VTVPNSTDDLTLTYADATGAADSLTINLVNNSSLNFGDITIASIENLTITTAEATASSTIRTATLDLTATGLTTLTISGTESLNLEGTAIGATTINASGLTTGIVKILGNGANQNITGSLTGADSINGAAGADTIDGGAANDTLLGGTGTDSITGGEGIDSITGGSGNDTIVLTETTAAVDSVVLDYSNVGVDKDTITGFTTTSTGDVIRLGLTALETAGTSGVDSTAVNFVEYDDDNGSDGVAGATSAVQVLTTAASLTDEANVFVLSGATFASISDVEDAIEAGGSYAFAIAAGDDFDTAQNAFIVVWTDGTDAHVSALWFNTVTTAGDTDIESGDLNSATLATISGVSSIGSTTFANANFVWY